MIPFTVVSLSHLLKDVVGRPNVKYHRSFIVFLCSDSYCPDLVVRGVQISFWWEIFFSLFIAMAFLEGRNIICLGKMVTDIDCCDA